MEVKQRLESRKYVYGMMLSEFYVPNIVRIISSCDFDFLLVDCEHGYFDMTQVANLVAVAEGVGLPIIVRVGQLDKSTITKYLDMGARGILLANTSGVEEARQLAKLCLYAPLGDRGVSTFRAHTGYNNGDTCHLMQQANEKMIVICQIESPQAAEQIGGILDVEGISGVLVGPNDLSQHMGIFGQYDHPMMKETLHAISDAAIRSRKWAGIITGNQELLAYSKSIGMTCFSSGSELNMFANGAHAELAKLKSL